MVLLLGGSAVAVLAQVVPVFNLRIQFIYSLASLLREVLLLV